MIDPKTLFATDSGWSLRGGCHQRQRPHHGVWLAQWRGPRIPSRPSAIELIYRESRSLLLYFGTHDLPQSALSPILSRRRGEQRGSLICFKD
jgi:hypothetical protein